MLGCGNGTNGYVIVLCASNAIADRVSGRSHSDGATLQANSARSLRKAFFRRGQVRNAAKVMDKNVGNIGSERAMEWSQLITSPRRGKLTNRVSPVARSVKNGRAISASLFNFPRASREQSHFTASRIARAALTIAARAGRTSFQCRVLSPQSGLTQSWAGDNTLEAFFKSPSISSSVGIRGEWIS
jgi:hypothetical protein